jgi:predicted DNA-binding transcriptional regulator YafY
MESWPEHFGDGQDVMAMGHRDQHLVGNEGSGGLDFALVARRTKPLALAGKRWILSWMPDVEVLEPPELRKRVAENLRHKLENQGG